MRKDCNIGDLIDFVCIKQQWYAEVICSSWMVLHNTVIMFHLRKGPSASYILAHPINASGPTLGAKNVTQFNEMA